MASDLVTAISAGRKSSCSKPNIHQDGLHEPLAQHHTLGRGTHFLPTVLPAPQEPATACGIQLSWEQSVNHTMPRTRGMESQPLQVRNGGFSPSLKADQDPSCLLVAHRSTKVLP